MVVLLAFDEKELEKNLFKIHYTIGKQYGNLVSKQLRKDFPLEQKKWKPLPLFNEAFQNFLINYYKEKGGELIVTLNRTMADRVTQDIISGSFENESVKQMTDRMFKTVNDPKYYRWMCLRIARTETSFAMNSAKYISGDVSGVLMRKIWIGRNDGKERDSHISKNGQKVGPKEYFKFGNGVELRYPGDRDGKGGRKAIGAEVINCRCTVGFEAERDENGRLIFTD
jgi:hypothetical protein